jgi:hypothetical protein
MQSLTAIDDFIAYQAGTHIVTLRWTNHGVYNVAVSDGVHQLDDLGGSYPTEHEARLVARAYAQMFNAEANQQPATLDDLRQTNTRRAAHITEPLARVLATADPTGYIRRGKTASIRQLIALDGMGMVELDKRRDGRRWVIDGARLTAKANKMGLPA